MSIDATAAAPRSSDRPGAPERHDVSRWSLGIAAFSTVVEWYDFTLYLYLTTVLARVFYGDGADSIVMALLTFAIAYLMRPIGAIVFGHIGDRFGRKSMMLWSMGIMTIAMLVTALLPTSAAVGGVAGWLMLLMRLIMAFSVGGEYTGVVAYLTEGAKASRRGFIASLAAASSEVGALLAAGVAAATVAFIPQPQLDDWGWRIPFLIGAALAAGVWIARSSMHESPEFERQQEAGSVPESPALHTLRHAFPAVLRTFAISALGSITYYVGITYVPTYLHAVTGMPESDALWISTVAAFAVIAITPFVGALSDRVGRRPVMVGLAVLGIVLPLATFWALGASGGALTVAGVIALAFLGGGVSAVAASATAEQFPGEGRVSGLALGVTMATAIFGGLAPLVAQTLSDATGDPMMPGYMMAAVAVLVLPVMLTMRETAPRIVDPRGEDPTGADPTRAQRVPVDAR